MIHEQYLFQGRSIDKRDFLIARHDQSNKKCGLYIIDFEGKLKKYKILDQYGIDFRQFEYNNDYYYAYNLTDNNKYLHPYYALGTLRITDSSLNQVVGYNRFKKMRIIKKV